MFAFSIALLLTLASSRPAPAQSSTDPLEPNETPATAAPLAPGTYTGTIGAADNDYFAVDLVGGDSLHVTLSFEHDLGDLDLKITDANNNPLSSSISTTDFERVFFRSTEGARLWVWVYGYLGATNTYTMTVEVLPNGGIPLVDDPYEENDTREEATPGAPATPELLACLDDDWFRFDLAHHDTLTARLEFIHRIGDIDALLLDAAENEVAAATSGSDNELLVAPFLPAGTYWLHVYGYEGAQNAYTFDVTVEPPAGEARFEIVRPVQEMRPLGEATPGERSAGVAAPHAAAPAHAHATRPIRTHRTDKDDAPRTVPGEFLVRFTSWEALDAFEETTARSRAWAWRPLSGAVRDARAAATTPRGAPTAASLRRPAPPAWIVVAEPPAARAHGVTDADVMKHLRTLPGVDRVEPNRLWEIAAVYNPPELDLAQTPYYELLGLPTLWASARGEGVVVAVIDTGVDAAHPDLAPNIWRNDRELAGAPGVDDDANGYVDDVSGWDFVTVDPSFVAEGEDAAPPDANPADFLGHGTAVAGVLAAAEGNASTPGDPTNLVGVAPRARIMRLRAGWAASETQAFLNTSDWVEAIYYAADNGAHVVNMSFTDRSPSDAALDAVEYARARGVLLVAAAGNQSFFVPRYPAAFEGVLSVGSTRLDLVKSSFSNYGTWVDAMAFGESILAPRIGSGYLRPSGTSFASPMVAGIGALLMGELGLSAREVEARLRLTARDLVAENPGLDDGLGWGLVQANVAADTLAEERAGAVMRILVENVGDRPGTLSPAESAGYFFLPPTIYFGAPAEIFPGERRIVEYRARAFLVPPHVFAFPLLADSDGSPALVARAKALAPDAAPLALLLETGFEAGEVPWELAAVESTAMFPFTAGAAAADGGTLSLATTGAMQLALTQGPALDPIGAGDLLVVTFDVADAILPPGASLRCRIHSANWNSFAGTTVYAAEQGVARRVSVVLPEGPATLSSGLRSGFDLIALDTGGAPAAADLDRVQVRTARLPGLDAGSRLDASAVPSLDGGWIASIPSFDALPPGTVSDAAEGGLRIALPTNAGAAAFAESPVLALEADRLYRASFTVRGEGNAPWHARPPLILYAYAADGSAGVSRVIESQPGEADIWIAPSTTRVDLHLRTAADGLPGGPVRFGLGLYGFDANDSPAAALRVVDFTLSSAPDPIPALP